MDSDTLSSSKSVLHQIISSLLAPKQGVGIDLVADMRKRLCGLLGEVERGLVEVDIIHLAESIFSPDSPEWPLHMNVYYLGKHPSLSKIISETQIRSTILRKRVISHIFSDWHTLHQARRKNFRRLPETYGCYERM